MTFPSKSMVVSVGAGRVAAIVLEEDRVRQLKMSRRAAKSSSHARRIIGRWIRELKPDFLISENPAKAPRKGRKTKRLLRTIETLFAEANGLNIHVMRRLKYPNRYEEAKKLAELYPEADLAPPDPPPPWKCEPRIMRYFEALSLLEVVRPRDRN